MSAVPVMGFWIGLLGSATVLSEPAGEGGKIPPSPQAARPSAVDLRPWFRQWGLSVRSQGGRGTCSVFAVVGALEYAVAKKQGRGLALSVEFLNWAAHQAVGRTADGGFFSELWKGFQTYGLCPEEDWPYQPQFDPTLQPSQTALEHAQELQSLGLRWHWIKEWDVQTGLTEAQLEKIRCTLRQGWPVCAGLRWPKQERWEEGLLQMCPPEEVFDGHSVLLVGYRDEPGQPGGGLFLIHNSGGGSREGRLPYAYVQAYTNDAAWVETKVDHDS